MIQPVPHLSDLVGLDVIFSDFHQSPADTLGNSNDALLAGCGMAPEYPSRWIGAFDLSVIVSG